MAPEDEFDEAIYGYDFSPGGTRRLLFAAAAALESNTALPEGPQDSLKEMTGTRHRTYGSAARAILTAQFPRSGNWLLSFYTGKAGPLREPDSYSPNSSSLAKFMAFFGSSSLRR